MKAVTWQGRRNVEVKEMPDPVLKDPTDAIIRITSTNICGSDLHLYEVMEPFLTKDYILGHEPMGIVEAIGSDVTDIQVGDRVVVPFNVSCGHCYMCERGLQSQCETTQVREEGHGASLLGFTKLYGELPGGQAELLRVPHADYGLIKVPEGPSDDRFVYLSDILPTAWQAVEYAAIPEGGSVAVFGLGPVGDFATRIAKLRGAKTVIGIDLVPDRLARAKANGVHVLDLNEFDDDLTDQIKKLTDGRGADSVIDAVGMEADGSPNAAMMQRMAGFLPDGMAQKLFQTAGVDRLNALYRGIDAVRRGGTISIVGVYSGMADPMPMDTLFDKQVTIRMGQANVKRWIDDIMPHLMDESDPLGTEDFATHHLPLEDAPHAYEIFQKKQEGAIKIILQPTPLTN